MNLAVVWFLVTGVEMTVEAHCVFLQLHKCSTG